MSNSNTILIKNINFSSYKIKEILKEKLNKNDNKFIISKNTSLFLSSLLKFICTKLIKHTIKTANEINSNYINEECLLINIKDCCVYPFIKNLNCFIKFISEYKNIANINDEEQKKLLYKEFQYQVCEFEHPLKRKCHKLCDIARRDGDDIKFKLRNSYVVFLVDLICVEFINYLCEYVLVYSQFLNIKKTIPLGIFKIIVYNIVKENKGKLNKVNKLLINY